MDAAREHGPARVLVVEDDPEQLEQLVAMVRRAGHDAYAAGTGAAALRLRAEVDPQLVLLDLHLPDLDGFAMLRKIKREVSSFVPVVLLTGYGDPDSKRRAIEAGADEFLQKPVSPFELELRLRSLLRIKGLTDELRRQNDRLLTLANTDSLCGIPNRRSVLDQLAREARRASRHGTSLAVALFDLDHFKNVNDLHGHATGDAVLCAAAQALSAGIRDEDSLGRFGGEEFLVVAPQIGLGEAGRMAERLRQLVADAAVTTPSGLIRVTASVGVAATTCVTEPPLRASRSGAREAARLADELLREADQALYAAKGAGRNRVVAGGESIRQRG
jgi:two-component system chemotaxis response regulator CheY